MTATTVPLTIVCPDWCVRPAEEHAADLWEMGGNCIHITDRQQIEDTTGFQQPLEETRYYAPVEVMLSSAAHPHEGRECESPVMFIHDTEMSVQQALDLASAITSMVDAYRATGGLA